MRVRERKLAVPPFRLLQDFHGYPDVVARAVRAKHRMMKTRTSM